MEGITMTTNNQKVGEVWLAVFEDSTWTREQIVTVELNVPVAISPPPYTTTVRMRYSTSADGLAIIAGAS
jgi:hypothetical protein